MRGSPPLVTLFGAVAGAVWLGGYRPALVAAIAGYFACKLSFHSPSSDARLRSRRRRGPNRLSVHVLHHHRARRGGACQPERSAGSASCFESPSAASAMPSSQRISKDGSPTSNKVAESLTGWTQNDALGRPIDEVLRIVNEATREPAENPALRALRDGVVVGLANHTTLIRRDGAERPIDDSAAPIKDERRPGFGLRDDLPRRHRATAHRARQGAKPAPDRALSVVHRRDRRTTPLSASRWTA